VNIGYATVAKRVNVKKLKTDIWSKIDVECVSPTNENINPNEKEKKVTDNNTNKTVNQVEKMSFKNMVTDMSVNQEQKEVSLSFYFICLLHLANEKTLTIKGTQGMDDLIISKDI
jgi:condensin complex subunit 2